MSHEFHERELHAADDGRGEHDEHRGRHSRQAGYADHSHHDPDIFKRKFWLSLALTIPTLVFSHGPQDILGLDGPRFPGSQFIPAVFGLDGMDFWWELATLITIMLLGHWIEMAAVMGAQDALGELAKLLPDTAELVHGDHTMTHPVSELKVGDVVLVRPGGRPALLPGGRSRHPCADRLAVLAAG